MVPLPQELIDLIVLHSDEKTRHKLLTISPAFQGSVERQFNWHSVTLHSDNIKKSAATCHGPRIRYIQNVRYDLKFPPLQRERNARRKLELPCRDTKEELAANDECFTSQVAELFDVLGTIEKQGGTKRWRGIDLVIHIHRQGTTTVLCDHRKYHNWRLHLLRPRRLTEVQSVRSLTLKPERSGNHESRPSGVRPFDLRVIMDLTCKLPNLEELECPFLYERFMYPYMIGLLVPFCLPWEGPWRDSRHDFARAVRTAELGNLLPTSFKKAELHFFDVDKDGDSMQHHDSIKDLVHPKLYDPLSSGIRTLSQGLEELDLRIIADPTLFWPFAPIENKTKLAVPSPPTWPLLKHLRVEFHPLAPNGTWYFHHPHSRFEYKTKPVTKEDYPPVKKNANDSRDDRDRLAVLSASSLTSSDMFRTEPDRERVEPLLDAFARALRCMPAVEEAELFSWLIRNQTVGGWGEINEDEEVRMHRWG